MTNEVFLREDLIMYRLFILQIILITKNYSICLMVEGIIIGFSDMLSIAQTIGIVGTMVLTLFSQESNYRVCRFMIKLEF
jgi:hypothetical protein